jgi:hypothetical protein
VKAARAEAQHSSATPSWGTPRLIVDLAIALFGRIDFDPFSDPTWNTTVGAERFLTVEDDSFACAWFDGAPTAAAILADPTVYPGVPDRARTALDNPPGCPRGEIVKDAWRLTEWHHRTGWLAGGVLWVSFNIGQLATLQGQGPRSPLNRDFLRCIPRRRIAYDSSPGVKGGAPPHAGALVLLPAPGALGWLQRARFEGFTAEIGEVF